jgi:DNA invertase Pin-like site-specific DNA recombinase
MPPPPRILCYLYARYSSDRQNPLGCDDQLARGRAFAKRLGWRISGEYRDEAVSGSVGAAGRAGWAQLLADVAAGRLGPGGRVVLWSISRWSRDYRDGMIAALELDRHGARLVDCTGREYDLSTGTGRITLAVDQHGSAAYLEDLRRATVSGQEAARARGGWTGAPPYGYRLVRDAPKAPARLVAVPAEAAIIRQVFRLADRGATPQAIAKRLNGAGVATRRHRAWQEGTVRQMLTRRLYIGERHRGLAPLSVQAILRPDLWQRVAARYGPAGSPAGRARDNPLSGLVVCGRCGRKTWIRWSGTGARSYVCSGAGGGACPGVPWARVDDVEAEAMRLWRSIVEDPARLRARARLALAEARAVASAVGRRGKPAAAELADLEAQEARLLDLAAKSVRTDQLARRLEAIESRRRDLRRAVASGGSPVRRLTLAGTIADLTELVESVTTPRELRPLLARVVLQADGVIRVELA